MTAFSKLTLASVLAANVILPDLAKADFCDEQSDPSAYPRKYAWAQQVISLPDDPSPAEPFLYTPFDMIDDGAFSDDEFLLLERIFREINQTGSQVAVILPIPRVLTRREILGERSIETDQVLASYLTVLNQFRDAGAIAPDVFGQLEGNKDVLSAYYFPTDPHWTPVGTLHTALALRHELDLSSDLDLPPVGETYLLGPQETVTQPGSLARAIEAVCGTQIAPIEIEYPSVIAEVDGPIDETLLFSDSINDQSVLLAGTSFTNFQNDKLRWSDAIRYGLQVDPKNIGVGAGGMATSMLSYALDRTSYGNPDLLVWEVLWVHRKADWGNDLRQIFGTLAGECQMDSDDGLISFDLGTDRFWNKIPLSEIDGDILSLRVPSLLEGTIRLKVNYQNGEEERFRVVRSSRLPDAEKFPVWSFFIGDPDANAAPREIDSIELNIVDQSGVYPVDASICHLRN